MQQLSVTTPSKVSGTRKVVAREILDAVPPVIWFIRREMRAHRRGLSMPQFRTLCKINSEPLASLSAVAEHLEASLPTASRIVAILVKKGLLARKGSSADRRQMELVLTAEGRAVLEEGWSATQAEIEKKIGSLSDAERGTLEQAMKICKELFGAVGVPEDIHSLISRQ